MVKQVRPFGVRFWNETDNRVRAYAASCGPSSRVRWRPKTFGPRINSPWTRLARFVMFMQKRRCTFFEPACMVVRQWLDDILTNHLGKGRMLEQSLLFGVTIWTIDRDAKMKPCSGSIVLMPERLFVWQK